MNTATIGFFASTGASGSDAFDYWWQRRGPWVEDANLGRGGESGVQILPPLKDGAPLLYCKRQSGHLYYSPRYPLGRPTIWREMAAYRAFARLGIVVPNLVYAGIRRQQGKWQGLLVSEELQGFVSLDEWYAHQPQQEQRQRVVKAIARTLAQLYRGGWRHGCCYDKHLFVKVAGGKAQIALLDLEKSRRPLLRAHCCKDVEQLARHCGGMPDADMQFLRARYQALCQRPQ